MANQIAKALQAFLDEVKARPVILTPKEARDQIEKLLSLFALPKQELPFIADRFCHYSDHAVPVRIYHPNREKVLPVMMYFHGGGHVSCSIETHDAICRRLAVASECVVLSVDYRLAPEFPYPVGLEDCLAAFDHRNQILAGINADIEHVFIAGDSAGGNLALSVCYKAKSNGDKAIQGLALIYPSVDFTMQHDSIHQYGEDYLLTQEKIAWYFDQYFAHGGDRVKASPIYFDHIELLPPIYLAVAEFDPLCDEAVAFAEKAKSLGVDVELENFEGMIHAFAQLEKLVPDQVIRLVNSIGRFIKNQRMSDQSQ